MKSATWDKITKISHFSYFTTKIKLTYSVDDIFTLEQIVYADYKAENCTTPCTSWTCHEKRSMSTFYECTEQWLEW